jgi:hypothetical protein
MSQEERGIPPPTAPAAAPEMTRTPTLDGAILSLTDAFNGESEQNLHKAFAVINAADYSQISTDLNSLGAARTYKHYLLESMIYEENNQLFNAAESINKAWLARANTKGVALSEFKLIENMADALSNHCNTIIESTIKGEKLGRSGFKEIAESKLKDDLGFKNAIRARVVLDGIGSLTKPVTPLEFYLNYKLNTDYKADVDHAVRLLINDYLKSNRKKDLAKILQEIEEIVPETVLSTSYDGVVKFLPLAKSMNDVFDPATNKWKTSPEKFAKMFDQIDPEALKKIGLDASFGVFKTACYSEYRVGNVRQAKAAYDAMEEISTRYAVMHSGEPNIYSLPPECSYEDHFYEARAEGAGSKFTNVSKLQLLPDAASTSPSPTTQDWRDKPAIDFANKSRHWDAPADLFLPFGQYQGFDVNGQPLGTYDVDKDGVGFEKAEKKVSTVGASGGGAGASEDDYVLPSDNEIDDLDSNPYGSLLLLSAAPMNIGNHNEFLKPIRNVTAPEVVLGPKGNSETVSYFALLKPGEILDYTVSEGEYQVDVRRIFVDGDKNKNQTVNSVLSVPSDKKYFPLEWTVTPLLTQDPTPPMFTGDTNNYKIGSPNGTILTCDAATGKLEVSSPEGGGLFLVSVQKVPEKLSIEDSLNKNRPAGLKDCPAKKYGNKWGYDLSKKFSVDVAGGRNMEGHFSYYTDGGVSFTSYTDVFELSPEYINRLKSENFLPSDFPVNSNGLSGESLSQYNDLGGKAMNFYNLGKIKTFIERLPSTSIVSAEDKTSLYMYEAELEVLTREIKIADAGFTKARNVWNEGEDEDAGGGG